MMKKCVVCRREFKTYKSGFKRRKTCSHRCNAIHLFKGKPKSNEWKEKARLAHLGKKRPPFSNEWRKNLSKARKGKKFTPEHCKNISLAQRMEKGNNWKGGVIKTSGGYIMVKTFNHPYASKTGYVYRSHLVLEKILGRYIKSPEEIHHINHIKDDDRSENLQLFPNHSTHMKSHYTSHRSS